MRFCWLFLHTLDVFQLLDKIGDFLVMLVYFAMVGAFYNVWIWLVRRHISQYCRSCSNIFRLCWLFLRSFDVFQLLDQLRDSWVTVVCFVFGGVFCYIYFVGPICGFLVNVVFHLDWYMHFSIVETSVWIVSILIKNFLFFLNA